MERSSLLIADGNRDACSHLKLLFSEMFVNIDCAADGIAAIKLFRRHVYHLVILDAMLPVADGRTVCRQICKMSDVPVVIISERSALPERLSAYRSGAEDYIVKPFEAVELLARIEVVLRRSHKGRVQIVYDDITIDMDRHLVTKAGEPVALTPKEFSLLAFFMENVDVAVTRERLEFQGESRTVDIHVQQLRKKLDLSRRLITIPKLGYRLESR